MTADKKHIAVIVNYFPTVSETFIVNQINSLMDSGYEVSLYAYHQVEAKVLHTSFKTHNLLDRVRYFVKPPKSKVKRFTVFVQWTFKHFKQIDWSLYFKTLNVFAYGKDAYTLKLFFEAQWFLVPYQADVIHAHFGMVGKRLAYLKAKGILPETLPLLTTFHGYDLEPNQLESYKGLYKHLFVHATAFTVNTPYLEGLLNQVNCHRLPVHILPVGLDTDFFKRTKQKTDLSYFDLVFCGRLVPFKGPDLAIEIVDRFIKMGYDNVRLHIIGRGELMDDLQVQVNRLNLKKHVLFYGAKTQEEIKVIFEQADMFLLPGRFDTNGRAETQGLVLQEAQAMELPVVVSDVGGMKYGLIDGETGFVVKEGDVEGFVKNVERLIKHPELKIAMGLSGRQFVVGNYDNHFLTKRLLDIYKLNLIYE
ncbi:glycosyltransferase [Xanthomarina gelatinilytica]|uniref:glycosyltransferase n=1 Tax=Xanthomarina gelatinilytica TaxID=1137281 RepID=UPI003AA80178